MKILLIIIIIITFISCNDYDDKEIKAMQMKVNAEQLNTNQLINNLGTDINKSKDEIIVHQRDIKDEIIKKIDEVREVKKEVVKAIDKSNKVKGVLKIANIDKENKEYKNKTPIVDKHEQMVDVEELAKREETGQATFSIPLEPISVKDAIKINENDKTKPLPNSYCSNVDNLLKEYEMLRSIITEHDMELDIQQGNNAVVKSQYRQLKEEIEQLKVTTQCIKDNVDKVNNKVKNTETFIMETNDNINTINNRIDKAELSIKETDADIELVYEELEIPYNSPELSIE